MTDAAVENMRAALAAYDRAAVQVAMELDLAVSLMPSFTIPSTVLQKLDDWREAAALLFPYLMEPGVKEMRDGSTQDQATREAADNAEPNVVALGGWLRYPDFPGA